MKFMDQEHIELINIYEIHTLDLIDDSEHVIHNEESQSSISVIFCRLQLSIKAKKYPALKMMEMLDGTICLLAKAPAH